MLSKVTSCFHENHRKYCFDTTQHNSKSSAPKYFKYEFKGIVKLLALILQRKALIFHDQPTVAIYLVNSSKQRKKNYINYTKTILTLLRQYPSWQRF